MAMVNGVLTVLPPPPGYPVDFANPRRQAVTETYWVAAIGNFVALLFMAQRLYTKLGILHIFQAEDGKPSIRDPPFPPAVVWC